MKLSESERKKIEKFLQSIGSLGGGKVLKDASLGVHIEVEIKKEE
jgi:hypothetical protein